MTLAEQLYIMMQSAAKAMQPADFVAGTVTAADPLEITCDNTMQVLKAPVLILTEPVIEKKIPVLTHKHYISTLTHTHTCPTGATSPGLTGRYLGEDSLVSERASTTLQQEDIVCYENGKALPIEDGYIILNRKLEEGDRVVMVRVNDGQRFIVLSREFKSEEGGE